jgi:hypothetical protein
MTTLSRAESWLLQAGTSPRIAPGTTKSRIPEAPRPFSHPESGGSSSSSTGSGGSSTKGDTDSGKAPAPSQVVCNRADVGDAQVGVCRIGRHNFEERWRVALEGECCKLPLSFCSWGLTPPAGSYMS